MKQAVFALPIVPLMLALTIPSAAQETSVTGKLVDVATYVTRDHNMDSMHAMKGGSMSGDHAMSGASPGADHAMSGDSIKGDHMTAAAACPPLGIVTDAGRVYAVATQMGVSMKSDLCKKLDSTVSLTGKLYTQGGMSVFLVTTIK